jgi:hypothetical protein
MVRRIFFVRRKLNSSGANKVCRQPRVSRCIDKLFRVYETTLFYIVYAVSTQSPCGTKYVYFLSICGTPLANGELWVSKSPKDLSADW